MSSYGKKDKENENTTTENDQYCPKGILRGKGCFSPKERAFNYSKIRAINPYLLDGLQTQWLQRFEFMYGAVPSNMEYDLYNKKVISYPDWDYPKHG